MAWFMVALDRSIRRAIKTRQRYDWRTRESWQEQSIRTPPGTEMPRSERELKWVRDRGALRLFSIKTRNYLRRRSWRYFRQLGKSDPKRYVLGIINALARYTDQDVSDGLSLIDNWGLVHALFHDSDVIEARATGWVLGEGMSLGDLKPAPAFADSWKSDAKPLFDLLDKARCRPVRQWTIQQLNADHSEAIKKIDLATLRRWLTGDSSEVAEFASDLLETNIESEQISPQEWVQLLVDSNPSVVTGICRAATKHVSADQLSLDDIVTVAKQSSASVARLGCDWIQTRSLVTRDDCVLALEVCEAESEIERPNLVRAVCGLVSKSVSFDPELALEVLDCRHVEVRQQGWQWLMRDSRLHSNPTLWLRLVESPYDDIQLPLSRLLEKQALGDPIEDSDGKLIGAGNQLPDTDLRRLWASVLLNTRRGGLRKPGVVIQIIEQLKRNPEQFDTLQPILAIALQSIRPPEWKAALAGIVRVAEQRPSLRQKIESCFGELLIVEA